MLCTVHAAQGTLHSPLLLPAGCFAMHRNAQGPKTKHVYVSVCVCVCVCVFVFPRPATLWARRAFDTLSLRYPTRVDSLSLSPSPSPSPSQPAIENECLTVSHAFYYKSALTHAHSCLTDDSHTHTHKNKDTQAHTLTHIIMIVGHAHANPL